MSFDTKRYFTSWFYWWLIQRPGRGARNMKSMRSPSASIFFTIRSEVAKVMFLQVSVCPRGGGGGWYPSMPCRWYPSMPCSRSLGGCYPSMHCRWYPSMPCNRSPGGVCLAEGCLLWGVPTPGGSAPGGVWRPPESRRLLLQTLCILLECILVMTLLLQGPEHGPSPPGSNTVWGYLIGLKTFLRVM